MPTTIGDLEQRARKALKEWVETREGRAELGRWVRENAHLTYPNKLDEIARGEVPEYDNELLEVLASSSGLMHTRDELGCDTVHDLAQWAIADQLNFHLQGEWDSLYNELEGDIAEAKRTRRERLTNALEAICKSGDRFIDAASAAERRAERGNSETWLSHLNEADHMRALHQKCLDGASRIRRLRNGA